MSKDAMREALGDELSPLGVSEVRIAGMADRVIGTLQKLGYYLAPLTTEGGPTARTSDPRTSQAFDPDRFHAGTQAARLLETFGRWPDDGLTDEQAMERSEKVSPTSEYAKRCSDLRSARLIEDTGHDRKGNSGLDRIVSRITDKGRAALARLEQEG